MKMKMILTIALTLGLSTASATMPKHKPAGKMTFNSFIAQVLGQKAATKKSFDTLMFIGTNKGATCRLTATYWGGKSQMVEFDVREGTDDDDSISTVQVQSTAGIHRSSEKSQVVYNLKDNVCHGHDIMKLQFADEKSATEGLIRNAKSIASEVHSTSCHEDGPETVHSRSCSELSLAYVDSKSNYDKLVALVKNECDDGSDSRTDGAKVEDDEDHDDCSLTRETLMECSLSMNEKNVLDCRWDISGDPGSDSGATLDASFALLPNEEFKVIRSSRGDKYD